MNNNIINDYVLERYVLGELPGRRVRKIRKWLKVDAELREKVEEIKRSNQQILIQYPSNFVVPKILHRYNSCTKDELEKISSSKPIFLKRLLYASPAFVIALVIILILLPLRKVDINFSTMENLPDNTRIKGRQTIDMSKSQLLIHRKCKDHIELLKNGARGKAGDLLQLAYVSAKELYGVILSIDGNGNVTLHFPDEKDKPTSLEQYKKILLPNAIELDNAPEFERFFFITSGSQINVDIILKKAEKLASFPDRVKRNNIDLPQSINQYSIIILKGDQS